ncbi:uncharacterized protein LY89DRAFT_677715 [Mollisia scopiformis]|uniref:BTB domain-containing protein n=1 Tax=Mollisia scopiformis TaxID=149040 RepID=A0A132B5F9_MOLSC|nr:uncharacterized protein LY89DRAFT_677715 [Mollisia scopiformis]KUJ07483.1 hypothetical protein LY89DRAFT_677715 [Mollisia scopiformis]
MESSTATVIMSSTTVSPSTLSMQGNERSSSQQSRSSMSPARSQPPSSSQRARNKGPSFRKPQAVVTINVGEADDLESFVIHQHLLTHYSSYFATAFSPPHTEAETKIMTLPIICPDTFGLVTHWLYTQQLDLIPQEQASNVLPLAKLWCLAAKFRIAKLQNKVMSWLQPLTEGLQGDSLKEFLCFVYENEEGESLERGVLKKLAIDRMAWGTSAKALGVWIQGGFLPGEMVVDVLMALKGDKEGARLGAWEYFVSLDGDGVAKVEDV